MDSNFLFALIITLLAGLSTGIGSAIAFFAKKTNTKFLSTALGFSAGVMVYVSFVELFPQARELVTGGGASHPELSIVIAFFVGIAFIFLIDMLIPSAENPHEVHMVEEMHDNCQKSQLKRTGVLMALAIAIHNFPEGIATFTSAYVDPGIAIPIAIAIAIHNIPEGIAVSVPIYYATGDRKKAFWYSFASGMAEPVGGLVGYFLLMPFLTPFSLGLVMAGVAGIMVFISVDELIPAAERYGEHHYSIAGFVGGMAVMALSLLLL
ncbi:zinc transporter ZupT [Paludibacter sp. 221]|uniref:zinc transporter ZupT n=1 Tax=Paludibacter sp. 221 TaxID=2302939 RepID=UPI0013D4AC7A|nr:zinc transporter ZupT [Paludibacter sp. 221]NDV46419.1 zinc transporter ZupT [Paludibacter sp. 221]